MFLLVLGCESERSPEPSRLFATHCGSCHLPPDPASLPKAIWRDRVLPEMGARLGMRMMSYDPEAILGTAEYELAATAGHYPDHPRLTTEEWEALQQFIITGAPDSLPDMPRYATHGLSGFRATPVDLDSSPGSLLTYLGSGGKGMVAGTGRGRLYRIGTDGRSVMMPGLPERSPIVHVIHGYPEIQNLLEVGLIYPTETRSGRLYRRVNGALSIVADSLHRPVHVLSEDLDGDGREELYVSEFGNYSGGLLRIDSLGKQERLLALPGCTRTLATDLNRDGRTDLIVLHAQGDEGITALYQTGDGDFRNRRLLRFPPGWGTSWFELVDTDGDGDLDLVTVHGDNADYSPVLKPYHGLRIHENDGTGAFTEAYFYPLYGATRVVADDFDGDGDVDLAVSCYFPAFGKSGSPSFVYLERKPTDRYLFTARTTPVAEEGRWLVMEAVDADDDGDADIALGSFTLDVSRVPQPVADRWQSTSTDLLILENLYSTVAPPPDSLIP
jgi:hypothetical protein